MLQHSRAVASVMLIVAALAPLSFRAPDFDVPTSVKAVAEIADGRTVLAPEPMAEDLAAAGVRVWLSNPIDAFSATNQAAYLDTWLSNKPSTLGLAASSVLVAPEGSAIALLAGQEGFGTVTSIEGFTVMERPSR